MFAKKLTGESSSKKLIGEFYVGNITSSDFSQIIPQSELIFFKFNEKLGPSQLEFELTDGRNIIPQTSYNKIYYVWERNSKYDANFVSVGSPAPNDRLVELTTDMSDYVLIHLYPMIGKKIMNVTAKLYKV
jgi:hypothetical protein